MSELVADVILDASKLKCPLPVIKAKKCLNTMTGGQLLKVIATDVAAPADFKSFCGMTGHELVMVEERGESGVALWVRCRKTS